jgi:hypothetical protein
MFGSRKKNGYFLLHHKLTSVFITQNESVYCAVRIESFIRRTFVFKGLMAMARIGPVLATSLDMNK